jgi:hypothetical protein
MNKLNPLHLIALVIVLILFTTLQLSQVHTQLNEQKETLKQTQKLAIEISALKNAYTDATKIKQSLQKILKHPSLKKAKFQITHTKNSTKISAASLSLKELETCSSKILNGVYNIKMLKIKKIDTNFASFEVEIAW